MTWHLRSLRRLSGRSSCGEAETLRIAGSSRIWLPAERSTLPRLPALARGAHEVFDEVISPIIGADSSFRGYVRLHRRRRCWFQWLAVSRRRRSCGSPAAGFCHRSGPARTYTIDSVAFGLNLVAAPYPPGLKILLYRLLFRSNDDDLCGRRSAFVPGNLIRTIDVPDT